MGSKGKVIQTYAESMGFELINPRNWTYATPSIYLSDMHDENVIRSPKGNIFVVDCDIRINTPDLRCGGIRNITNEVKTIEANVSLVSEFEGQWKDSKSAEEMVTDLRRSRTSNSYVEL